MKLKVHPKMKMKVHPRKVGNAFLILGGMVSIAFMILFHKNLPNDQNHASHSLRNAPVIESGRGLRSQELSNLQQSLNETIGAGKALLEELIQNKVQQLRTQVRSMDDQLNSAGAEVKSDRTRGDHGTAIMVEKNTASNSSTRFAYAFVIGGVNPDEATPFPAYLYYIYDILVSTYIQRQDGSTSDVFVFFQMSYASKLNALPEADIKLLNAMNIKFDYIPKNKDQSFYHIMLDKFRILTLTQYERVLFLDGDIMPRRNLDYLFELSVSGVLKKNALIAGRLEPGNGGFFLMTPEEGAHQRILEIIDAKNRRGRSLPYPHWDEDIGWGHKIEAPDHYELNSGRKNTSWSFHGAFADQGLLYHFVKYEQKSVSIFFNEKIQNWDVDSDGKLHLEKTLILTNTLKKYDRGFKCWPRSTLGAKCRAPFSDYVHFTGRNKPWKQKPPGVLSKETAESSAASYWYYTLSILNRDFQMGLDFENWNTAQWRPLLGFFPLDTDHATAVHRDDAEW